MMLPMLVLALLSPGPQEAPPVAPPPVEMEPAAEPMEAAPAPTASAASEIEEGLKAYRRRQFQKARAAFERAVAADPQSAAAHYYLGYVIYKQAEPRTRDTAAKREALEHFTEAFRLDPTFKPQWQG